MSKYIDRIRSEAPASLYVFNQQAPGNITDEGFSANDLTLVETGEQAVAVPSLVPGERWSVYTPVAYDFDGGVAVNNHVRFTNAAYSEWEQFYSIENEWALETVFRTGYSTRSRAAAADLGVLWGLYDGSTEGLVFSCNEISTGWELSIQIALDTGMEVLASHEVSHGSVVHAAVINVESNFTLMINGKIVDSVHLDEDSTLLSGTFDNLHIGGRNAQDHSNVSALASFAMFERATLPERVIERYHHTQERRTFNDLVSGYGPRLIFTPEQSSIAVLAPELDDLFEGSDTDLEYDSSSDSVTIKDSSLSAGLTATKKKSYDLTEIDAIGQVYHNYTATTGANSSVTVDYSFDDITYNTLSTGTDTVPDISQDWAQAAEGAL